ncbi:MAG: ATP-binding protein [Chloroflexota bacterium]|nr:ATP-binding protein [Chloroflexota bacterium]
MDPIRNPYAPGAGTPPPELAGRDDLRNAAYIALERTRIGRPSKSLLMVGLRGVGKTVLLNRIRQDAEHRGIHALRIEAPEERSLPSILAPELRIALIKLSNREAAKVLAQRALRGLAGFVGALKLKYQDIEVGLDFDAEPGLADNGDLEIDLQDLLAVVGEAAWADGTCVAIFIDELQYVAEDELAALITALHRISQRQLPVIMLGAGLPQIRGQMGRAKSYAERLFEFPEIGPLTREDAKLAIAKPAAEEGVEFEAEALDRLVEKTHCYPYFLQEWGKHVWDTAEGSPISLADIDLASQRALATLDGSFFLVRFDRLTPTEKRYVRAMASLGAGPHRSGDIANALGRRVSSLAPTRNQLISKGMIWSPGHGDTAFTVPMFDEFMVRIMPGDAWQYG